MAEKYYLDACIWIDYLENRSDKFRPLGDWAIMIINKIIREGGLFIFSDHILKELLEKYPKEKLIKFLEIIPEELIIKINASEKQAKEAFKLKNKMGIPFGDALHAVLARDNNAILVSRDKHFHGLINEVNIKKPEELI